MHISINLIEIRNFKNILTKIDKNIKSAIALPVTKSGYNKVPAQSSLSQIK